MCLKDKMPPYYTSLSTLFDMFCCIALQRGYAQRQLYAIMRGMSPDKVEERIEELYALISGHVQGVGFRYFVAQKARHLGLRGYARNDSNGDVIVVAQGAHTALEYLLVQLRQGPPAAQVHKVRDTWRGPTEHLSGFHIRF
jgi:acylphosphatase